MRRYAFRLTRLPSGSTGSSLFRYWCSSSCGGSAQRFLGDTQSLQRPAAFADHVAPRGAEQMLSLQCHTAFGISGR